MQEKLIAIEEDIDMLSQGQGDRFDRRVEFLSAVILALATVMTAWCGYQAARWGGEQANFYAQASTARVQAAKLENQAMLRGSFQANLFVQYITAIGQDHQLLADYLYENFAPELKIATDAWWNLNPLTNPDAPPSPFDMPEYQLPELARSQELTQIAESYFADANEANEQSDLFVLLTVIFATVLFFGGISGKFQWRFIDGLMLGFGGIVFATGLILLFSLPMR